LASCCNIEKRNDHTAENDLFEAKLYFFHVDHFEILNDQKNFL